MGEKKISTALEDSSNKPATNENESVSEADRLSITDIQQYPGLNATLQCATDLDEGELLGL